MWFSVVHFWLKYKLKDIGVTILDVMTRETLPSGGIVLRKNRLGHGGQY